MYLPIDDLRQHIEKSLANGTKRFIINAPTGSGKSTRLPLFFSESKNINGKIIVLQPRRAPARLLAKFLASSLGSNVGDYVGWHIRFEKNYSQNTKIIFVTEGILAKMILNDPLLLDVGAIIFDEFHERNIYSDISLGLALNSRKNLIIAVCSATLQNHTISSILKNAETFHSNSRLFPIDIQYAPPKTLDSPIWDLATTQFEKLASTHNDGNFLIFMPGAFEISKTISSLLNSKFSKPFDILPLYGDLSPQLQDKALSPSSKRKIIVATNIAETSLTIDNVRFVIDSGLAKIAKYDPSRAINTLLIDRISLANASQRAGRAGRTHPGKAIRLWNQNDELNFQKDITPEILRIEISQILLWLKSANLDFSNIPLINPPDPNSIKKAETILSQLGAIKNNKITSDGLLMSKFPTSPRLAKLLIESARRGCLYEACIIAAITEVGPIKLNLSNPYKASARDNILKKNDSEILELLDLCFLAKEKNFNQDFCLDFGIHLSNSRKVFQIANDLFQIAKHHNLPQNISNTDHDAITKSLISAFPDCLCVRLNEATLACNIIGGKRGEIHKSSRNFAKKIFLALNLKEQNLHKRVNITASLVTPVSEIQIRDSFPNDFNIIQSTQFDQIHKRVVSSKKILFRDLMLNESISDDFNSDDAINILTDQILSGNLFLKNYSDDVDHFISRVNFIAEISPESGISKIDQNAMRLIYNSLCSEASSYSEIKNANILKAFQNWLSPLQLQLLNSLAPQSVSLPNRKKPAKISYDSTNKRAIISSLFKDFFDFNPKNLKIANGKISPTFEILAPNGRPIQITQNLDQFWKTSWIPIKKDLQSRYPKHFKN